MIPTPSSSTWLLQQFLPLISLLSENNRLFTSSQKSFEQLSTLAKFLLQPLLKNCPTILSNLNPYNIPNPTSLFTNSTNTPTTTTLYQPQDNPNPLSIPFIQQQQRPIINDFCFSPQIPTPLPTDNFQLNISLLPLAKFYIVPKVHKRPISSRPIANSISSFTSPTSKLIDQILRPLMLVQESFIYSSSQLINDLNKLKLPQSNSTTYLAEADVDSMYPSIDLNHGLYNINSLLIKFSIPNRQFIIQALHWILHNNYLFYENNIYLQIKGVAMGTNVAVTFSCLYLSSLEIQAYSNLLKSSTISFRQPIFFRRYIDDIASIWYSEQDAIHFFTEINSIHSNIHLTYQTNKNSIKFLDVYLTYNPAQLPTNQLSTKTYQKEHCLYQYLPASSFHPTNSKLSWITADANRYCILTTSYTEFSSTLNLFKQRLIDRGYSTQAINNLLIKLPDNSDHYAIYRTSLTNSRFKTMPTFNTLVQLEAHLTNKSSTSPPILYKTIYNPILRLLHLPSLLQYTDDLRFFFFYKEFFEHKHHPILCYINSKSILHLLR